MTEVTSAESARIISHMNKDHEESLTHYLEYFGRKSRAPALAKPRITEFTSESMTVEYSDNPRQSWTYKFEPPMQAGQARVRLESMHREAKEGLGISDVEINNFSLPITVWVPTLLVLALDLWLVLTPSPSIARTLRWQQPLFRPILSFLGIRPDAQNLGDAIKLFCCGTLNLAHFIEIFACLNPLLRRYNVQHPLVRFLYMLATQIGGFPVWQALRDDGLRQQRKLDKKH